MADSDCKTGSCSRLFCALVSGPPNWLPGPPLNEGRGLLTAGIAVGQGKWMLLALGGDDYADNFGGTDPAPFDYELLNGSESPLSWRVSNAYTFDYMNNTGVAAVTDANGDLLMFYESETWLFSASGALQKLSTVMPTPRIGSAAALAANGLVYVIGGVGDSGGKATIVEAYDPVSATWTTGLTPKPTPGGDLRAATGHDNLIYVTGGDNSATFEAYDPKSDTWSTKSALPAPDTFLTVVTGPDGRIYALGGMNATVNAYTTITNRWTAVAPLSDSRYGVGVAVVPDGHIWAIGGTTDVLGAGETIVQIYGPPVIATPQAGQPGTNITINGSNFAANASVFVYFQSASGQPAGMGTTDGTGSLTVPIPVRVPSLPAGPVPLIIVDDRSQYPITLQLQVQ